VLDRVDEALSWLKGNSSVWGQYGLHIPRLLDYLAALKSELTDLPAALGVGGGWWGRMGRCGVLVN
jgi:hypothetical protein